MFDIGELLNDSITLLIGNPKCPEVALTWNSWRSEQENRKISVNRKIRALEKIEAEQDPKIKRRMQLYFDAGIYDFSDIENI